MKAAFAPPLPVLVGLFVFIFSPSVLALTPVLGYFTLGYLALLVKAAFAPPLPALALDVPLVLVLHHSPPCALLSVLPVCDAMDGSHCCVACGAGLLADDGHDLCPACLGLDHLRDALSDNPCMNCRYMSHAVRVNRLAQFSPEDAADLSPSGQVPSAQPRRSKRVREPTASSVAPKPKRSRSDKGLSAKVEQLSAELVAMRSYFQAQNQSAPGSVAGLASPPMPSLTQEEDVLSLAASASHFRDDDVAQCSRDSETGSLSSAHSLSSETACSMQEVMREALGCLHLEVPQPEQSGPSSAFFKRGRPPTPFAVPSSEEFLRELHACWRNPSAFARLSSDGRILAAMQNAAAAGLDRIPTVEPGVAALIVSPEEALRQEVRCPRPQCRVTDDLVSRAYNSGARAGRLGNSLAHLMFALSASLQGVEGAGAAIGFSEAALQAFALLTRELGRVMGYLVQTRRQVWLAQSSLSEACRRTLRGVPVEPGQMFGSAAVEALERTVQARHTRQQLSSLSRSMPPPPPQRARRVASVSNSSAFRPRDWAGEDRYHQQRRGRDFRASPRQPTRQPRASDPGRRPPRPPGGRGARK